MYDFINITTLLLSTLVFLESLQFTDKVFHKRKHYTKRKSLSFLNVKLCTVVVTEKKKKIQKTHSHLKYDTEKKII